MEFYQLQYFKAASECGNITQAAGRMHVSQPALSMAINKLEEELGVRLFERQRGKIFLNKNGEIFLTHVDKILSDIDEAIASVSPAKEPVRISYNFMFPMRRLMMDYLDEYPDALIHHESITGFENIEQKILSGDLDFAVAYMPISMKCRASITTAAILDDPQYVMMSVLNPLASRVSLEYKDLEHCRYIKNVLLEESDDHNYLGCKAAGFTPVVVYEGNRIEILDELVSQDRGITFVGEGGVKMRKLRYPDWESIFRFVPLKGGNTIRTIVLVSGDVSKMSEEARQLYDYILNNYTAMSGIDHFR